MVLCFGGVGGLEGEVLRCFGASVLRCFGGLLLRWFGASAVRWFGGSVVWWFGGLVVKEGGSVVLCFGGAVVHGLVLRWFGRLVVRRFGASAVRWYGGSSEWLCGGYGVCGLEVEELRDVSPTKRAPSSHGAFMARFGSPSVAPTRQKSPRGPLYSIQCGWQHIWADRFKGQRADEH